MATPQTSKSKKTDKKAHAKKPEAKVKAAPAKAAPKHEATRSADLSTGKKHDAPKAAAKPHPAGAKAIGPSEHVITRKWHGKTVEAKAGTHIRVELPENVLRGMSWQLQKLPHGVQLAEPEVAKADGVNQNRIFNFSVEEEGDYLLQFNLGRFGGQMADTFKVKVTAKAD